MLDSMMSSAGLPLAEQRRLRAACAAGPSAPIARRGGAAAARRGPPQQQPYEDLLRGVPINPTLARQIPGAKLRSKEAIVAANGGTMERPQFGGAAPQNRGLSKEALQQKIEFGYVLPELPSESNSSRHVALPPKPKSEEDILRNQIVEEIDERREFLQSMRAAGRGKEHEDAILSQISERVADLKKLEELSAN